MVGQQGNAAACIGIPEWQPSRAQFLDGELAPRPELEQGRAPKEGLSPKQKGAMSAKILFFCELYNSFTLCQFSPLPDEMIAKILFCITGKACKPMDLLTFGERSLNLKRAINNILGVTREEDKMPGIARRALKEGGTAGIEPDMDLMLKDFYTVCQWDWETGKPQKAKLLELGLERVAKDLYA